MNIFIDLINICEYVLLWIKIDCCQNLALLYVLMYPQIL